MAQLHRPSMDLDEVSEESSSEDEYGDIDDEIFDEEIPKPDYDENGSSSEDEYDDDGDTDDEIFDEEIPMPGSYQKRSLNHDGSQTSDTNTNTESGSEESSNLDTTHANASKLTSSPVEGPSPIQKSCSQKLHPDTIPKTIEADDEASANTVSFLEETPEMERGFDDTIEHFFTSSGLTEGIAELMRLLSPKAEPQEPSENMEKKDTTQTVLETKGEEEKNDVSNIKSTSHTRNSSLRQDFSCYSTDTMLAEIDRGLERLACYDDSDMPFDEAMDQKQAEDSYQNRTKELQLMLNLIEDIDESGPELQTKSDDSVLSDPKKQELVSLAKSFDDLLHTISKIGFPKTDDFKIVNSAPEEAKSVVEDEDESGIATVCPKESPAAVSNSEVHSFTKTRSSMLTLVGVTSSKRKPVGGCVGDPDESFDSKPDDGEDEPDPESLSQSEISDDNRSEAPNVVMDVAENDWSGRVSADDCGGSRTISGDKEEGENLNKKEPAKKAKRIFSKKNLRKWKLRLYALKTFLTSWNETRQRASSGKQAAQMAARSTRNRATNVPENGEMNLKLKELKVSDSAETDEFDCNDAIEVEFDGLVSVLNGSVKDSIQDESSCSESSYSESSEEVSQSGSTITEESVKQNSLTEESVKQNSLTEESVKQNSLTEESGKQNSLTEESGKQNSLTEESVKQNSLTEESGKQNSLTEESGKQNSLPEVEEYVIQYTKSVEIDEPLLDVPTADSNNEICDEESKSNANQVEDETVSPRESTDDKNTTAETDMKKMDPIPGKPLETKDEDVLEPPGLHVTALPKKPKEKTSVAGDQKLGNSDEDPYVSVLRRQVRSLRRLRNSKNNGDNTPNRDPSPVRPKPEKPVRPDPTEVRSVVSLPEQMTKKVSPIDPEPASRIDPEHTSSIRKEIRTPIDPTSIHSNDNEAAQFGGNEASDDGNLLLSPKKDPEAGSAWESDNNICTRSEEIGIVEFNQHPQAEEQGKRDISTVVAVEPDSKIQPQEPVFVEPQGNEPLRWIAKSYPRTGLDADATVEEKTTSEHVDIERKQEVKAKAKVETGTGAKAESEEKASVSTALKGSKPLALKNPNQEEEPHSKVLRTRRLHPKRSTQRSVQLRYPKIEESHDPKPRPVVSRYGGKPLDALMGATPTPTDGFNDDLSAEDNF